METSQTHETDVEQILATTSSLEDSALGSMMSEEGEASDASDRDKFTMNIQGIIDRLDNTAETVFEEDEGFSSMSCSTLNMVDSNVFVGECDPIETKSRKQKYKINEGLSSKHGNPDESWMARRRFSEPVISSVKSPNKLSTLMRKLSLSRRNSNDVTVSSSKRKSVCNDKHFSPGDVHRILVESLPQMFPVKYLGSRRCTGVAGAEHTRGPVDSMIDRARSLGENDKLPEVKLIVTHKGIDIRACSYSGTTFMNVMMPIEFVSYGVQDAKFTRVFTCIVVKELSSRAQKMECHAYMCESSLSARKIALSIALAFKVYTKESERNAFRFEVDLKEEKPVEKREKEVDCEA